LTIANPQPIGMLIPQIPTPLAMSQVMATVSIINSENATANPASQPIPMGRVSTTSLIFSVTDSYVCPGASTGVKRRISGWFSGASLMPCPSPD
jgi:hypothetical protein